MTTRAARGGAAGHARPTIATAFLALAACTPGVPPSPPAAGATGTATPSSPSAGDANARGGAAGPAAGQPLRARGICPAGPFAASPLAAAAAPAPLADIGTGFVHLDGPTWRASTKTLVLSAWSDSASGGHGPISTLLAVTPAGAAEALAPAGTYGSNGLAVDGNDDLIAALHDREEVARLMTPDGSRASLASTFGGHPFNAPNDLAIRRDGNIYFTDPNYQADGRPGQGVTGVYRIAPGGQVDLVDGGRDQPNGIALSLDDQTLWVGGNDRKILAYPLAADGHAGAPATFIDAGDNVDGMAVDCAGNLWAVLYDTKTVAAWSAAGARLATLPLPESATNLAFGGDDRKTLFITALTHLYAVRSEVPGLPY